MGGKRNSGGADFDDLMAAMGVRPLDARKGGKEGSARKGEGKARGKGAASKPPREAGRTPPAPRQPGRSPRPAAEAPVPEAPVARGEPAKDAPARPPSKAAIAAERALRRIGKAPPGEAEAPGQPRQVAGSEETPPAELHEALATRTRERDALRVRVAALQQQLDEARAAALAAEAVPASAAPESAQTAAPSQAEGPVLPEVLPAPEGSLLGLLSDCGILGADEAGRLLRALADAHLLPQLLQHLGPTDAVAAARVIRDRVQLLGGCEACPVDVPGRVVLEVPRQRCEVCAGGDARRLARGFVDGLLLLGLTKAALVGGSALEHQQLRRLVAHHRLELDLVPPGRLDLLELSRRVDVMFLWRGSALAPAPAAEALPEGLEAVVVEIEGRGLAALLAEAPAGLSEAVAAR